MFPNYGRPDNEHTYLQDIAVLLGIPASQLGVTEVGLLQNIRSGIVSLLQNLNNLPAGGGVWGSITGTITDQADLVAQLAARAALTGAAFTGANTITLEALGTTPTAGLSLINSTAAAAGAQQVSPGLVWEGQGWKTDATAASQSVAFRAHVLPIQGSSAPQGRWKLQYQINGGALADAFNVDTNGLASATSFLLGGGTVAWASMGGIAFPANGVLQFFTNGFASNVDLVCAASARLQLGQDAAGVTHQMITAANRITSNGVGANLTIAPGNGRGAAGGSLILSTYTTGGSGVAGTLTPRLYVNGPNGMLQFGGQTSSSPGLLPAVDELHCKLADDSGFARFAALHYSVGAGNVSGATAGPFASITSITVEGGIVTDLQGS